MSRFTFACIAAALFLAAVAISARAESADNLVVHEWGTFTSLQDEAGNAIGGINADDEPVPGFVHRLGGLIVDERSVDRTYWRLSKSVPSSHPDVTMRLETPVLYFHPPKDAGPMMVDVSVTFRGGWLTEYFPYARQAVNGKWLDPKKSFGVGHISQSTDGTLNWANLRLGGKPAPLTQTGEHVWLAPRAVSSIANVTAPAIPALNIPEQSERFLFYRGVGHVDSPLRVKRDGSTLTIDGGAIVGPAWLVDIASNGACAFRPIELTGKAVTTPAAFGEKDYRPDCADLRAAMRGALISDGLFADEADAMLNTWEVSYFKNSGTRVFFLVPRAWTDRVLPLSISSEGKPVDPRHMARTMVGRVELVTPTQRDLLKVVAGPASAVEQIKAFRALGRFRDAMVIAEQQRQSTPALTKFMEDHLIHQPNLSNAKQSDVSSGG